MPTAIERVLIMAASFVLPQCTFDTLAEARTLIEERLEATEAPDAPAWLVNERANCEAWLDAHAALATKEPTLVWNFDRARPPTKQDAAMSATGDE